MVRLEIPDGDLKLIVDRLKRDMESVKQLKNPLLQRMLPKQMRDALAIGEVDTLLNDFPRIISEIEAQAKSQNVQL